MSDENRDGYFQVVTNDRAQFGVWPLARRPPDGWRRTAFAGNREACREHIVELAKGSVTGLVHPADTAYQDPTFTNLIDCAVRRYPDAAAVSDWKFSISYRQLHSRSEALAAELAQIGIGPGDGVALELSLGVELVVAMVGVLKIGASYLLLHPYAPQEWRAAVLNDAAPRLVLVDSSLVFRPDGSALQPRPLSGEAPAVLLYPLPKEGTARMPPGVAWGHGLLARLAVAPGFPRIAPGDRVSSSGDPSGRLLVTTVGRALAAGGEVVLRQDDSPVSPAELRREGLRQALIGTPSWSPETIEAALWYAADGTTDRSVRMLGFAGTAGLCTINTTANGPGEPLPGVRMLALHPDLTPVPPGQVGRLFVGGWPVTGGYLGRPDLTADRYVPDPWAAGGDFMFDTGIPVLRNADDTVSYVGAAGTNAPAEGRAARGNVPSEGDRG